MKSGTGPVGIVLITRDRRERTLQTLDRLTFLSPTVKEAIAVRDGWPLLDRCFRSTDPDVLFVGFAAERRFGPIARFVSGSRFTAHRARQALDD